MTTEICAYFTKTGRLLAMVYPDRNPSPFIDQFQIKTTNWQMESRFVKIKCRTE